MSAGTVAAAVGRARVCGLTWTAVDALSDDALERRLFGAFTSSDEKPLRMSRNSYPKSPIFRSSVLAAFQRSLTRDRFRDRLRISSLVLDEHGFGDHETRRRDRPVGRLSPADAETERPDRAPLNPSKIATAKKCSQI